MALKHVVPGWAGIIAIGIAVISILSKRALVMAIAIGVVWWWLDQKNGISH
jgi:hypothetical protein